MLKNLRRISSIKELNISDRLNPFYKDQVHAFYKDAESMLANRIDKSLSEYLMQPQRMIRISIPLKKDNGTIESVYAYHVQHSSHIWPCQGGLKVSKNTTALTTEAQAFMVTLRNALSEIPFGGSKGGICIDKNACSENELSKLIYEYANILGKKGIIGVNQEIIGPEMGIVPAYSNAMVEGLKNIEYEAESNPTACVTGKSRDMGGLHGREELPSYAVLSILNVLLNSEKFLRQYSIEKGVKNKRVIVQGFGNMGYWISKMLEKQEARIVGIMESGISIHNSEGFIVDEVKSYYSKNKTLLGYQNVDDWLKNDKSIDMLYYPCDILVSSAVEFVVDTQNAKKISAAMILEIASNSVTHDAHKILYEKGVPIIPDILLSSGAGILSYLEWMKGKYHGELDMSKILSNIKTIESGLFDITQPIGEKEAIKKGLDSWVSRVTDDVLNYSQMENTSLKVAAYCLAIQRMNEYIEKIKQERTL